MIKALEDRELDNVTGGGDDDGASGTARGAGSTVGGTANAGSAVRNTVMSVATFIGYFVPGGLQTK
jgi:hypothetical protein